MPVYKLKQEMPYEELLQWVTYFEKRPVGYREDQRVFLNLQAQGYKGTPESVFASLKQMKENIPDSVKALPKGKFLQMMQGARGGDNDWEPFWLEKNGNKQ